MVEASNEHMQALSALWMRCDDGGRRVSQSTKGFKFITVVSVQIRFVGLHTSDKLTTEFLCCVRSVCTQSDSVTHLQSLAPKQLESWRLKK